MKKILMNYFSIISISIMYIFIYLLFNTINVSAATTCKQSDSIIKLTICTNPNTLNSSYVNKFLNSSGHAWLLFTNISNEDITVGHLNGIKPNTTISLGTWSNKNNDKITGILYNMEAYCYFKTNGNDCNPVATAYIYLTIEDLNIINSYIYGNDIWTISKNCTWFAYNLWNKIAPKKSKLSLKTARPSYLKTAIQKIPNSSTSNNIEYTNYNVYYVYKNRAYTYTN